MSRVSFCVFGSRLLFRIGFVRGERFALITVCAYVCVCANFACYVRVCLCNLPSFSRQSSRALCVCRRRCRCRCPTNNNSPKLRTRASSTSSDCCEIHVPGASKAPSSPVYNSPRSDYDAAHKTVTACVLVLRKHAITNKTNKRKQLVVSCVATTAAQLLTTITRGASTSQAQGNYTLPLHTAH